MSTTSSIYDPLGFASPFVLKAKAIFQELCRMKVDWDEELPGGHSSAMAQMVERLASVVSTEQFQDALDQHPLVVCYRPSSITFPMLRIWLMVPFHTSGLGDTCRLVMSKARLAPIKPVSIPRLELLAAVVATELDQHIKRHLEIPIERTFFWTDSTIVLQYINNKHCRFKTFVANRTSKIHERSVPSQWKHIDSASNPADDVSRGMSMGEILSSEQWVSGPHFLQLEEEHWPAQPIINDLPEEAEIKRAKEVYAASIKPNQVMKNAVDRLLERYSSWYRLKRATAILLRVKALLRKKASVHLSEPITVSEIQQAELAILKLHTNGIFWIFSSQIQFPSQA